MPDNDTSAGATPAAGGATPPQTPPATPAPATAPADVDPPATGNDDQLGDAGKGALEKERIARRDAERREKDLQKALDDLKAQGLSDSERAIAEAKKASAAEVSEKFNARIRRAEVRTALTAAGINASVLDLATKADEFAALKVTDDGDVEGLDEAVKAFKSARKDLFGKPTGAEGSADGGAQGGAKPPADNLGAAIANHYGN